MNQIGTKKRADEVTGRGLQLFDKSEDIRWALNTHVKRNDIHWDEMRGVILTGNEDSPDEIWVARKPPRAKRNTVYVSDIVELVYTGANEESSTV